MVQKMSGLFHLGYTVPALIMQPERKSIIDIRQNWSLQELAIGAGGL